jgi:RNA polymerase sigma-70 factor (ECF subfamily)
MLPRSPEPPPIPGPPALDLDGELIRRWQSGEAAPAEALIDRYLPKVRAFLAARCGNAGEADDLAQEVFIAVCRQIATYRAEVPFSGWLYGIARNKVADFWRRQRPVAAFEPHHEGVDERCPARIYEESEGASKAWRDVFALLPETQATALWLRIQEEMSMEQIAQALGVTLANAKVLLFRARQTLAVHWKPRAVLS